MKKIFLLVSVILYSFNLSAGINERAGTASALFLRLGVGARAIAMGNTFTAVADGINATYGNPAGVIDLRVPELNLMHSKWLADIDYGYAGYAQPLTDKSAIAASVMYVDYGREEKRNYMGSFLGHWNAKDMAVALSYGRRFNHKLIYGMNVKYISEDYEDEKANGFSFDFGLLYKTNIENLTLGLAIQNIGRPIKFVKEEFDLPRTYRFGLCYKAYQDKLTTGVDIVKALDTDWTYNIGAEWKFNKIFALRSGYTSANDIGNGFSGGVGFYISKFVVDYAFSPFGELGDTHRFSLTYKFPEF